MDVDTPSAWADFYKKRGVLVQLELQQNREMSLLPRSLDNQIKEANALFGKFIERNYPLTGLLTRTMHRFFHRGGWSKKRQYFPNLKGEHPTLLLVIGQLTLGSMENHVNPSWVLYTRRPEKHFTSVYYFPQPHLYARN